MTTLGMPANAGGKFERRLRALVGMALAALVGLLLVLGLWWDGPLGGASWAERAGATLIADTAHQRAVP
jgi:ferric-dicitrate binding protein FerR (iron transport regulator)